MNMNIEIECSSNNKINEIIEELKYLKKYDDDKYFGDTGLDLKEDLVEKLIKLRDEGYIYIGYMKIRS